MTYADICLILIPTWFTINDYKWGFSFSYEVIWMNSNIIDFIHENSHLKADGHKTQVVKREETQSQKWVKICKVLLKYY